MEQLDQDFISDLFDFSVFSVLILPNNQFSASIVTGPNACYIRIQGYPDSSDIRCVVQYVDEKTGDWITTRFQATGKKAFAEEVLKTIIWRNSKDG